MAFGILRSKTSVYEISIDEIKYIIADRIGASPSDLRIDFVTTYPDDDFGGGSRGTPVVSKINVTVTHQHD